MALRCLRVWDFQNAGLGDSWIRPELLAFQLCRHRKFAASTLETRQMTLCEPVSYNRYAARVLIGTLGFVKR